MRKNKFNFWKKTKSFEKCFHPITKPFVETYKKGGKYRIINCFPREETKIQY